MVIIGLTGSIGMGKSETANKFRKSGVPVFESDRVVHDLMAPAGEAFGPVIQNFPGSVVDGLIDRQKLGALVFDDDAALASLEDILHPLVRAAQQNFVKQYVNKAIAQVLLDIPLLYETGAENRCDVVAVVSAPAFLQARRVLSRPGMSKKKFKSILARQVPDYIKRQRADFVISTGLGHARTYRQIAAIIKKLRTFKGIRWQPKYSLNQ